METLQSILEKHHAEWEVIRFLKCNVDDYNSITAASFINFYSVRKILGWRSVGNRSVLKLAAIFDKEGLSLKF